MRSLGDPWGILGLGPRIRHRSGTLPLRIDGRTAYDNGMSLLKLGSLAGSLRGAAGNAVYVRSPYGTILRDRPAVWNEPTPAQIDCRQRMTRVGCAWSRLSLAEAAAWKRYAQALAASEPPSDGAPPPNAQQVFVRLGLKVLQAEPGATVPPLPPTNAFLGDAVVVSAEALSGSLRFTASAPNAPGILTELLIQPLRSVHRRTFPSRYRTAAFVPFSGGAYDVAVKPGVFAAAYRFVRAATGQETGIAELGVFVVR